MTEESVGRLAPEARQDVWLAVGERHDRWIPRYATTTTLVEGEATTT